MLIGDTVTQNRVLWLQSSGLRSCGCNCQRRWTTKRQEHSDMMLSWFLSHQDAKRSSWIDGCQWDTIVRQSKMTNYSILPFSLQRLPTTITPLCGGYWFQLHNGLNVWSTTTALQLLTAPYTTKRTKHRRPQGIYNTRRSHTNLVEVKFLKFCCERGSSKSIMFFMFSVNNSIVSSSCQLPDFDSKCPSETGMLSTSLCIKLLQSKEMVKLLLSLVQLSSCHQIIRQPSIVIHVWLSEQTTGAMERDKVSTNSETQLPLLNHDVRTTCRMCRSCFCNSSSTLCDWDNKGPEYSTFSSWSWSPWSFKWHVVTT